MNDFIKQVKIMLNNVELNKFFKRLQIENFNRIFCEYFIVINM